MKCPQHVQHESCHNGSYRLVEKNNSIYSEYLGNGDRSSFKEVLDSQPYHGRNKLTETIINSMKNCYILAIRNNRNDLYCMKKAVGTILFHCTEMTKHKTQINVLIVLHGLAVPKTLL